MTFYYPAVITKKEDGFQISFVDLEGCDVFAGDLEDALEEARYAGVNWILTEQEDGGFPPERTHLDDIELGENQRATDIALMMPKEGWDE